MTPARGPSLQDRFFELTTPLLVSSAENDRFGTAATARKTASMTPHAALKMLSDGGLIWSGHHKAVAQRMDAFIGAVRKQPTANRSRNAVLS